MVLLVHRNPVYLRFCHRQTKLIFYLIESSKELKGTLHGCFTPLHLKELSLKTLAEVKVTRLSLDYAVVDVRLISLDNKSQVE